jgi:hypothetical protein
LVAALKRKDGFLGGQIQTSSFAEYTVYSILMTIATAQWLKRAWKLLLGWGLLFA